MTFKLDIQIKNRINFITEQLDFFTVGLHQEGKPKNFDNHVRIELAKAAMPVVAHFKTSRSRSNNILGSRLLFLLTIIEKLEKYYKIDLIQMVELYYLIFTSFLEIKKLDKLMVMLEQNIDKAMEMLLEIETPLTKEIEKEYIQLKKDI